MRDRRCPALHECTVWHPALWVYGTLHSMLAAPTCTDPVYPCGMTKDAQCSVCTPPTALLASCVCAPLRAFLCCMQMCLCMRPWNWWQPKWAGGRRQALHPTSCVWRHARLLCPLRAVAMAAQPCLPCCWTVAPHLQPYWRACAAAAVAGKGQATW